MSFSTHAKFILAQEANMNFRTPSCAQSVLKKRGATQTDNQIHISDGV